MTLDTAGTEDFHLNLFYKLYKTSTDQDKSTYEQPRGFPLRPGGQKPPHTFCIETLDFGYRIV